MTQHSEVSAKPPLYRGFPLPMHELSPDSFEDFVYQALTHLSDSKGFEMQSSRQPSGDQGFDCTAKTKDKNELVCIQCKRYTKAINTSTVAEEIIKVALDNALNNSTVKQHYIITSGTVSGSLRRTLRQNSYLDLKNECSEIIKKGSFQPELFKKISKKNVDPIETINKYIDSLDKLLVWSNVDFHNELLVIWRSFENTLENFFSIEKILKDKPTPDFDVSEYLKKKSQRERNLTPLHYNQSSLPVNLKSENELEKYEKDIFSIDDLIELLKNNKNIILSSAGGSGKSYTLSIIEEILAKNQYDIRYIPVRVNLRSYSRNTLKKTIEQELGVSYGSWTSLPYKFILLFDGLDEMLQHDTQSFYDDLASTIGNNNYILTVRSTGVSVGTVSNLINICFTIRPLSYRCVFNIASKIFEGDDLQGFYNEYRSKINISEYNFLSSPFILSLSISYYKQHNFLPRNIESVLEDWVSRKINSDKSRVNNTSLKINNIPTTNIIEAISLVFYKAGFENNTSPISESNFIELMMECYDELSSSKSYLTRVLTLDEFISMVHHYETLYKVNDNYFSTPHAMISDYLSSRILAKNWRKYKNSNFNRSHYDIWLYCANSLDDSDKSEYLNTVLEFDICLGAKVAIKLKGDFMYNIQDRILECEKSKKVLTRSNAIFALGILGTEKCHKRLKSQEGYIDYHHSHQRRRALALNGDKETLIDILRKNEYTAQTPIKISGGDYSLWFTSPPTIITDIARERIEEWLNNQRPPLCMSLRTLALFGDSFDVSNLISVLKKTDYEQEFYDAAKALVEIDLECLIEELNNIIINKKIASHWAKKILISMGKECNTDDEFNYFIEQGKKEESELIKDKHLYGLNRLVDFLKKTNIDDIKTKILVDAYKNLNFRSDFYYRNLMWSLAIKGVSGCFLPMVELAYLKKDPVEINNAIAYLYNSDALEINDDLSKEINTYFESLNDKDVGIFYYYIQYYYKHKSKTYAINMMSKKITKEISHLTPESITIEKYNSSILDYNIVFDFIYSDTANEININEQSSLKFLLIGTEFLSDKEKSAKLKVVSKIDKSIIDCYCDAIVDSDVKKFAVSYILFNDLSNNPRLLIEGYLSTFLNHNFFHPTVECICLRYWDDDLARFFLTCFTELDWTPINAQLFEKYTNVFCRLLSRKQLEEFERMRVESINIFVKRIYQIWLESNNLTEL